MSFGKAEQGCFIELAGPVQRDNRALRRREIAAVLDQLGHPGYLAHERDHGFPVRLDHLQQAAANDVDRSFQKFL